MEYKCNIPVGVFMFKRAEKTAQIIDQIGRVQPAKIYLIADGPRNESEKTAVEECRKTVESHITWPCEVIKNYAIANRGVYENIAGGAKWVFSQEQKAIFLEDDNFPEISFFQYCEELLEKYDGDTRVLWICGTNYMKEFQPKDGSDYFFTKTMLPCGWASWSDKFCKFYDGELELYRDKNIQEKIKGEYDNDIIFRQDKYCWDEIIENLSSGVKAPSWDYQMAFSIRVHNMFGIAPKYNQIRNIGIDGNSIHGGTSQEMVMTERYCDNPTKELHFPLKHPAALLTDENFERETQRIMEIPFKIRFRSSIGRIVRTIFHVPLREKLTVKKILHLQ